MSNYHGWKKDWYGVQFDGYLDTSLWRRKIFSVGARVNFFPRRETRGWILHAHIILGFWLFAVSAEPMRIHPGNYS